MDNPPHLGHLANSPRRLPRLACLCTQSAGADRQFCMSCMFTRSARRAGRARRQPEDGAVRVAHRYAVHLDCELVRNGSHGALSVVVDIDVVCSLNCRTMVRIESIVPANILQLHK